VTAEASYPSDLRYHPEHDWARVDGEVATLGVTWFAQSELGDIVFCDLPDLGKSLRQGDAYAELESVKAVSDVIAPVSGDVIEINDVVTDEPSTVNEDPYGNGWLVRVRLAELAELQTLLSAEAYQELIR
jgi:glycine cleavage system H protein